MRKNCLAARCPESDPFPIDQASLETPSGPLRVQRGSGRFWGEWLLPGRGAVDPSHLSFCLIDRCSETWMLPPLKVEWAPIEDRGRFHLPPRQAGPWLLLQAWLLLPSRL